MMCPGEVLFFYAFVHAAGLYLLLFRKKRKKLKKVLDKGKELCYYNQAVTFDRGAENVEFSKKQKSFVKALDKRKGSVL